MRAATRMLATQSAVCPPLSSPPPRDDVTGRASAFFVAMGLLMLIEDALTGWLRPRCPTRVRALIARVPSPLIALGLRMLVLPAFEPLFVRSWLDSGMVDAVGELLPLVRCG